MATLAECRGLVDEWDRKIQESESKLAIMLAELKESVTAEVESLVADMNPAPTVMDTVELDANWWAEHGEEMGWIKDKDGYYVYTDPDTGETFAYNPKNHKLKQNGVGTVTCKLYLNGDPSDVTETVTLLKSYVGDNPKVSGESTRPQLIIAPTLTGDEDNPGQTAKLALMSSKFGDSFLKSGGNTNDVKRNICGFSMGGVQALKMVSGKLGGQYVGYYDKVTLVNISPSIIKYTDAEVSNMSGLEFDVVQNYNNFYCNRVGTEEFYTTMNGGPHLDKMAAIPGVKINLIVPDVSKDTHGTITKLVAHAEGLGADNVTITQYAVPEGEEQSYGSGTSSTSHENGRRILLPRYLAGDLTPIE